MANGRNIFSEEPFAADPEQTEQNFPAAARDVVRNDPGNLIQIGARLGQCLTDNVASSRKISSDDFISTRHAVPVVPLGDVSVRAKKIAGRVFTHQQRATPVRN